MAEDDGRENARVGSEGPPPWIRSPLRGTQKLKAYLATIALFFIMLAALIGGLVLFNIFVMREPRGWEVVLGIVAAVVIVAIFCLAFRALLRLNARDATPALEKQCAGRSVHMRWACFFRGFSGPGDVTFGDGEIRFDGRLAPSLLPPLLVIFAVNGASVASFLLGGPGIFIGGLGAAVLALVYIRFRRKDTTLSVRNESVAKARVKGGMVTMKFRPAPAPQLRAVSFYVAEAHRESMFREIGQRFEGALPPAYRKALGLA